MRPFLAALLVIGCGKSGAPPNAESEANVANPAAGGCVERYDITFTPGTTFDDVEPDAALPWPQPGVSFAATVVRSGDAVHIDGTLTNSNGAPATVDVLTGGAMGISTNPFQVDVDVQPRTATGPEVYPAPRRVVLPAHGTVAYRHVRCPTFPARVRWTFSPWRGDATTGDVVIE